MDDLTAGQKNSVILIEALVNNPLERVKRYEESIRRQKEWDEAHSEGLEKAVKYRARFLAGTGSHSQKGSVEKSDAEKAVAAKARSLAGL
jgi:hypothetical protein